MLRLKKIKKQIIAGNWKSHELDAATFLENLFLCY